MDVTRERLAEAAAAAARQAGVEVRELRGEEMGGASALFSQVWRTGPRESPMEPGLLVALGFAGNYVSGAFAPDGRLVGACAGFLGAGGALLHSHIAAAVPGGPAGTGTALKLHQRAWCAEHGIGVVAWTYDPLVARNAWFNLGRLGAQVRAYLVDFYGPMDDGLNAGEESDRLLVHWPVTPPEAEPAGERAGEAASEPGTTHAALAVGKDGGPRTDPSVAVQATAVTLAVPADVEQLRTDDRALASRWRTTFRDAYADLHEQGWRVHGFARAGHYVLRRP